MDDVVARCDVVLFESVDGRVHLEQVLPVLRAGKPVFVDKPLAASLVDAVAIVDTAKRLGVPLFSSSPLRFSPGVHAVRHCVEALFTVHGPECETVRRTQATDAADEVEGRWSSGRTGRFRGDVTGKAPFGGTVKGERGRAADGRVRWLSAAGRGDRQVLPHAPGPGRS